MKSDFSEIKRLTVVLDRCLDGHPENEIATERKLKERLSVLKKEIASLLSGAGVSRGESGPDATRRLESELGDRRRQLAELNANKKALRQEEQKEKSALDALSAQVKKTSGELQRLESRISELERNIGNRIILEKLWFLIFPDGDKAELARKAGERDAVQDTLNRLRAEAKDQENRHKALKQSLADLSARRNGVDEDIRKLSSQIDALDRAIQVENERESCAVRLKELHGVQRDRVEESAASWKDARDALSAAVSRVRERQPKIESLGPDDFGHATSFPEMFSVGSYVFSGGGQTWTLPRLLPFPFPHPLFFPPNDMGRDFVREVLLRAFQCIPPDALEITVCDPKHLGNSLAGFLALLDNRKPFTDRECLTTPKDIEAALSGIHSYMADFVQRDCVGGVRDWASFNAAHPDHPRPCKLLVMFDLPEQLTPPAAACLALILENGPRSGVLPLVSCGIGALDLHRDAALREALSSFSWDAFAIRNRVREFKDVRNFRISESNSDHLPDPAGVETLLSPLREDYRRRDESVGKMEDLYRLDGLWVADSRDGIETPIGWSETADRTPVDFSLGNRKAAVNHALLGGKTGSGKSNLIHVLLHGLCHRYSPEELNLYLLDYKDATEFAAYAKPLLPHARLVATESDVEFGISVLRHLEAEMTSRNTLFKRAGVVSLYEYREKTGGKMPRILLVVDEFQKFFEKRETADVSETLLENLLRLGRNAGVHLLLATQSLSGLRQVGSLEGIKRQLACRIALSCNAEDSCTLLGQTNEAAAMLKSPPQGILNNENGAKTANVVFVAPEATRDSCKRHLSELHDAAAVHRFDFSQCRVFAGNALPAFPAFGEFDACCSALGAESLLLGRTADFDAAPVVRSLAKTNLCIIGRRDFLPVLKRAVAESLSRGVGKTAVLLCSERPGDWSAFAAAGAEVRTADEDWSGVDLGSFSRRDETRKFVVLDGIEEMKPLHSVNFGKTSPLAAILADLVSRPEKSGVRLILCAKDYSRAKGVSKDLLALCGLRVGDSSIGDLAAFANFDASGSRALPPLPDDKALVADRDSGETTVFRPFGRSEEDEEVSRG